MKYIELKQIYFSYPDGREILRGLDLCLNENEKIGLIGSNGSGKTTMFHIIMGLLRPASGSLEILGRKMIKERDFRNVRQEVGLLFQDADDQLFCPTVLEDVAFGPLNQGLDSGKAKEIAIETLDALGLGGFENRITHKLSGGEKKLVSLATVLAMKPKILLLDEPTTGLDYDTEERIISILRDLPMSYIFISHNMDFLEQTTNKIYGMQHGRIINEDVDVPHTHTHVHRHGQVEHIHDGR
jgi:cobalt/nickel transport system ATP-binding protein